MFDSFKKSKKVEFILEPIAAQCIPYACHYNDHSILTKNGELMQVIRIEGLAEEYVNDGKDFDLRAIIRKAIVENVKDKKISMWFHTIRRKRNLDSINNFAWTFAKDTHDGWAEKNYWRSKFVNELYITLLYEGENYDLQKNLSLAFIPKAFKKLHLGKIAKNAIALENVMLKMIASLEAYGGKRLEVKHDNLGAHSEILEFLTKIACLKSKRVALPIQGIDNIFKKTKIAFGGNTLEIIDEKEKHFAAVFTIKESHEYPYKALDTFLRVASEYIISQTLNFVDSAIAKKDVEYLDYILTKVSKDEELKNKSGLAAILNTDKGKATDFGTQQMTISIIGESLSDLQRSISSTIREIRRLGMVVIREDLHMALCFWSQLPGNFQFFRRSSYINTARSASFASLHNTPSGKTDSLWGKSLTIFRRKNSAPHFFNLHVENNGNTLIVGPKESSKNMLVNFLLSEASKYDPNILYIDQLKTSTILVKAIGGKHETITLKGDKAKLCLNPFAMQNTPENNNFLKEWVLLLAFPDLSFTEKQKTHIFTAIDDLFANIATGSRQISTLIEFIEDEAIKESLLLWCKPNKFGLLFDNSYDELCSGAKVLGLNIAELLETGNSVAATAFVSYCLHQYAQNLDKSPTIIALNDANILLNHSIFTNMMPNFLDNLTANNALAILNCSCSKTTINTNISNIQNKIATRLFLPELNPAAYQKTLQLDDEDILSIKNMKALYRHFMIKQKNESIIAELNVDGMDYAIKALSGDEEAIEIMERAILEVGDNPNRWIIPFYRNLFPELN